MSRIQKPLLACIVIISLGLVLPEPLEIPVRGATSNDWNHKTFWFEPWGSSGVHKGIDIFGEMGTTVTSSTYGLVVFSGQLSKGGNAVAVLGPKWRLHYYAHLHSISTSAGKLLSKGDAIGVLGDTGNAAGKPPHLHYSIVSIVPIPWRLNFTQTQGWKQMFFLNPHEKLQ